jgi:signal transduction histidine kinase
VVDSADAVPSLGTVLVAPVGEWGLLLVGTDGAFDRTTDRVVDVLAANLDVSLARLTREQELADRNERLEQFSAVVSHDLRNPLSIAGGYVDLLQDREGYADAEELDRVAAAIARIEDIIGGVLALVADDEVQPEPVALRGVVTAAWGTADTADATVEYVGEDVVLAADRERLRQALENLFRNAAEHGGADVVRVGTTESGFLVEDDGSGLPADADTDVFEWGVSIDGGTGIGMAVVSHVADAHGWDVAVADPAPDRGVRIVFET